MRTNLQKTNFLGKKFVDKSQFLVQPERLELSWGNPTWPSTKPVYQFQHDRIMRQNK